MVVYVSESLNSKKNGGSSLSGLDFLQILRVHYSDISVVSTDGCDECGTQFYGHDMNELGETITLKRIYNSQGGSILRKVKGALIGGMDLFKKKSQDFSTVLEGSAGKKKLLFVNSWSSLYQSGRLTGIDDFYKVCIVRGNPESFVWQGDTDDGEENIRVAASYLEKFDALIFVSSIGKERWSKYLKSACEMFYLPNSINEKEVKQLESVSQNEIAKSLDFEDSVVNIACVGSIQKRKGQDMLEPVAKALTELGIKFKIHVIGVVSNVWGGNEILDTMKNSSESERFEIYGHRDDALNFVKASDICIFTSRAEAFPRTVAEYMALGKPIVATSVSGVPEMITHGENGLLCESEDTDGMVEMIKKLVQDKELREKLGDAARDTYVSKFAKKNQIEKARQIFQNIDTSIG